MRTVRLATVAVAALVSGAAALGHAERAAASPPGVKWGPAPPFLAKGARFAVMSGDPSQSGEFTIRLELPAGYRIKPHFHPTDEHVTVLSGRFLVGMGDTLNRRQTMALGPSGFITAPANAHHFAIAAVRTVVQVNGEGPFAITYVNAADDPRNATTSH
jgi:quercetin dioxygenase-like cupin family protein